MRYKSFKVVATNNSLSFSRSPEEVPILIDDLPLALADKFPRAGTYIVERVARGGVEFEIESSGDHTYPAAYVDGLTTLCRKLVKLLAWNGRKETIRVSVKRIKHNESRNRVRHID